MNVRYKKCLSYVIIISYRYSSSNHITFLSYSTHQINSKRFKPWHEWPKQILHSNITSFVRCTNKVDVSNIIWCYLYSNLAKLILWLLRVMNEHAGIGCRAGNEFFWCMHVRSNIVSFKIPVVTKISSLAPGNDMDNGKSHYDVLVSFSFAQVLQKW